MVCHFSSFRLFDLAQNSLEHCVDPTPGVRFAVNRYRSGPFSLNKLAVVVVDFFLHSYSVQSSM